MKYLHSHKVLSLTQLPAVNFAFWARKGGSYKEYKQRKGATGKDQTSADRAEYDKEITKRREKKLNWGIANRWEQRELEAVVKNKDVRASQFRDLDKLKAEQYGKQLADFNSVDEIYFFMDEMFTSGFDEKHVGIALDVFLRDFGQFEEEDLDKPTFK